MSAVESMRADLAYADRYRNRARVLDGLGMLLECETPGTVSEVAVKRGRWFRRFIGRGEQQEEIILSNDERREFADWCKDRASKLRKQANVIEIRLAKGVAE
ncbi:hypothetical protein [Arthrobacter sp. efr-133-TYG-118]|uniref:hypothetical protein n=1 Tax=Arthrobacter sp. efr-133-TYG-118 TaxID=3040279 RepID=UPI00254D0407|nr:hypothetical protein [Arthrobacter sp. efr-133-TYG-118]